MSDKKLFIKLPRMFFQQVDEQLPLLKELKNKRKIIDKLKKEIKKTQDKNLKKELEKKLKGSGILPTPQILLYTYCFLSLYKNIYNKAIMSTSYIVEMVGGVPHRIRPLVESALKVLSEKKLIKYDVADANKMIEFEIIDIGKNYMPFYDTDLMLYHKIDPYTFIVYCIINNFYFKEIKCGDEIISGSKTKLSLITELTGYSSNKVVECINKLYALEIYDIIYDGNGYRFDNIKNKVIQKGNIYVLQPHIKNDIVTKDVKEIQEILEKGCPDIEYRKNIARMTSWLRKYNHDYNSEDIINQINKTACKYCINIDYYDLFEEEHGNIKFCYKFYHDDMGKYIEKEGKMNLIMK